MIKQYLSILLLVLIYCSCVRKEIRYDHQCVDYANFKTNAFALNGIFNDSDTIGNRTFDSFFAKHIISSETRIMPKECGIALYRIFYYITYCTTKDDSLRFLQHDFGYINKAYTFFYGGRLKINTDFLSLIFVLKDNKIGSEFDNHSYIILLNIKDGKIRSAIKLGEFSINKADSGETSSTIQYSHNRFLSKNYIHTTEQFLKHQASIPSYDQFPHSPEESRMKYNIVRTLQRFKANAIKTKVMKFTTFDIDKNGYCLINNSGVDSVYIDDVLMKDSRW